MGVGGLVAILDFSSLTFSDGLSIFLFSFSSSLFFIKEFGIPLPFNVTSFATFCFDVSLLSTVFLSTILTDFSLGLSSSVLTVLRIGFSGPLFIVGLSSGLAFADVFMFSLSA